VCARAPGLTSVRDQEGWFLAGDMMVDWVIPLGEALRPLVLSRPSTGVSAAGSREPTAAHRVIEDLARTERGCCHTGAMA
jgi:hypothetical protein